MRRVHAAQQPTPEGEAMNTEQQTDKNERQAGMSDRQRRATLISLGHVMSRPEAQARSKYLDHLIRKASGLE
jgi:hypothetical protein